MEIIGYKEFIFDVYCVVLTIHQGKHVKSNVRIRLEIHACKKYSIYNDADALYWSESKDSIFDFREVKSLLTSFLSVILFRFKVIVFFFCVRVTVIKTVKKLRFLCELECKQ